MIRWRRARFLLFLATFWLLQDCGSFRTMSSVVAFSAHIICNKIPGLTATQRRICRVRPDAIVAIGNGAKLGIKECQRQFQYHRWNCTAIGSDSVFGHVVVVGSREAAYVYAISSAGVTYSVTQACSRGNINRCGCDRTKAGMSLWGDWKWGGCSADVRYGMRLARRFLDARELEWDARSLMNLHNNKAGRKAVKENMLTECKCHGVSGSCTMKTCWKTLPSFSQIGNFLMKKYHTAKNVIAFWSKSSSSKEPLYLLQQLRLRHRKPRHKDLVYLQPSPNYCDMNLSRGSFGTVGRRCNQTSNEIGGCNLLCCGRGYNTHQFTRTWQCNCKFHWCCFVKCNTCRARTEMYTCK
ncbi:protein Wnt-7b-like isoform X1 [Tachypleus tridentatus]|uniref:protein Wnt-7b-like isoform X1 n=2 Tax=Tachypleus tridentatus TaxID=6853 RepID=UPI003FD04758